ncbi:MAG: tetratricopeptide repeat protein [Chloroflexi bacterium]|nr:tetratricopeptide repeat protein [Chloroflexota bacterium]
MDKQQPLSQLRKTISEQFNKAGLRLLCSDLGVEYENLSGDTKDEQALSLVEWMERYGRLPELITAVHRRRPELKTGLRVYEHGRYNLAANFIGRKAELKELDDWLADASRPMFIVVALGGTGKSALTWHWLESVKERAERPFNVLIWHGFYETGRIDNFLSDVLTFWGEKPQEIGNKRLQLNRLLELLSATPTLIVLDGAERLLRAYGGMNAAYQADETPTTRRAQECVDPVAAELLVGLSQLRSGSKTLISSRLLPQELLGRAGAKLPPRIGRLDLTGLDPADAYRFFVEWGIQTTRAEVDAVCAPLDYHPFCMALLAGYAAADFAAANDLRAAADYDPTADLLGRRQHILRRAYNNLPPAAQMTLGRLAAFRAAVPWETIAATLGDNRKTRTDLHLLEQRGLLQRSTVGRQPSATTFDLHPIARRYAYERLADRAAVHTQLIVYFEAAPEPQKINSLTDLAPTIELYHHLTRAQRYDEAVVLFRDRLHNAMYYQLGAYQQMIELLQALFPDGEDKPPRLSDEAWQAWTLAVLANSYSLSGRPGAAVPLFQQDIAISEKQGDKRNTAVSLGNLADDQIKIGALAEAADNLCRSIELCQEIEDRFEEASEHMEYGRLLTYCGDWAKSAAELDTVLELFTTESNIQSQGIVWAYRALSTLLQGDGAAAQNAAQGALRLADETARTIYPVEADYVRVHWLLGWAALAQGHHTESQTRLDEALRRCRAINLVELEPAILLAQARLAHAQANGPRSLTYAQQALTIAQRVGYVLDLADIHNHLARLALDNDDTAAARTHAQTAHDHAFCDGPPYAYQTALNEAERILGEVEGLGD